MKKFVIAIALALVMSLTCLTGCGGQTATEVPSGTELASGGVLVLSVNPEIAVEYDKAGVVTGVTARNDDALAIIAACEGLIGQQTRDAVSDLVTAIGDAGYFVEEIEGERRQITIEIEAGSALPSDDFLDGVIADVKTAVDSHNWQTPLNLEGNTDYGITDYIDTDYGPGNDGYTDYADTDYGPNHDGVTDYDHNINDDTDYGPTNDGITDYDGTDYASNTDYGINADGNTDYNDSDYGVWGDGVTDYNDGQTNYDDTDYGPNNDGVTDYDDTDYGPNNDGITDYTDGQSNYDNGNSNYGNSNYDSNSNYGDSAYDD